MALCVAQIRSNTILELTDGWYGIDAHCDPALSQLVENGKIFVGLKLLVSGAELVAPGPSAPLEKRSDTYLKVRSNTPVSCSLKIIFFVVCIDFGQFHSTCEMGFETWLLQKSTAFSNLFKVNIT